MVNGVKRLFYQMKDTVRNKLSTRQHEDEASWSTRSWLSLQAQRMSVALQLAAADENEKSKPRKRRNRRSHPQYEGRPIGEHTQPGPAG